MAKVLVSNYRYVTQKEGEDFAERHVLRPGDDVSKLPKDVREDLEKRKLVMDERRFDKDKGVVLPAEQALERFEESEQEQESAPKSTKGESDKQ